MTTIWQTWTEPSLFDALAVAHAARCVAQRPEDPSLPVSASNPLIYYVGVAHRERALARLLLARDVLGKVEATEAWDLHPVTGGYGGRVGFGFGHEVYADTMPNAEYDIEAALRIIEQGFAEGASEQARRQAARLVAPTVAAVESPTAPYFWHELGALRGTTGATVPRARTAYATGVATKVQASRLYAAAILRATTIDAPIDAELAAQCAAQLTAARASILAQAQAIAPGRGYL